jgi:hypothetical protein
VYQTFSLQIMSIQNKQTSLHHAACEGSRKTVKLLLTRGAKIDAKDKVHIISDKQTEYNIYTYIHRRRYTVCLTKNLNAQKYLVYKVAHISRL